MKSLKNKIIDSQRLRENIFKSLPGLGKHAFVKATKIKMSLFFPTPVYLRPGKMKSLKDKMFTVRVMPRVHLLRHLLRREGPRGRAVLFFFPTHVLCRKIKKSIIINNEKFTR